MARKRFSENIPRCCGIDVDKQFLWASALLTEGKRTDEEMARFANSDTGIGELIEWLRRLKVTHVAFESTGVYWLPLFDQLQHGFDVAVGNSYHMKAMRGYKTDRGDGRWIASLLRVGSIKSSYVPPAEIRALREKTRMYRNLVEDQTRVKNRIVKTLRQGGVTIDAHMSTVFTKSGQKMIRGIIEGWSPDQVSAVYRGRRDPAVLKAALPLPMPEIYLDNLSRYWKQFEALRAHIDDLWSSTEEMASEYVEFVERLIALPGIGTKSAILIISEIGVDMSVFKTVKQFASWAGLCPGNNRTGGKRKSGLTRKGNRYLRVILVECSWASVRVKDSPFRDYYYSIKKRMGGKKAIVAVAHKMLRVIYAVMRSEDGFSQEYARTVEKRNRRVRTELRRLTMEELEAELVRRREDEPAVDEE